MEKFSHRAEPHFEAPHIGIARQIVEAALADLAPESSASAPIEAPRIRTLLTQFRQQAATASDQELRAVVGLDDGQLYQFVLALVETTTRK